MAEYLVVSTNFEGLNNGDPPPSPWTAGGNTLAEVITTGADSGTAHSGTKMLELGNLSTSTLTGTGIQSAHFTIGSYYTNEFLLEYWMRFDAGYPISAGTHSGEFLDSDGGGSQWYFVTIETQTSFQFAIPSSLGSFVGNNMYPGGPGTTAVWFRVRYYYNQTTGVYKIWYNDTEQDAITPKINGDHWNDFTPLANLSTGSGWTAPVYAYMDDFKLYSDLNTGLGQLVTSGSMANGDPVAGGSAGTLFYGNRSLR